MKNKVFTILYTDYRHLLMKIVVDRSGDSDLAEEICQQAFVAFYQKMDTIDKTFYKPWLMLAAKNAVIDYLRKRNFRREFPMSDCHLTDYEIITEDNTERIVDRMVDAQLSFRILEDLKKTNEGWYQVIEAVCVQEMRQEQAAEYLQVTPQVLRAKLYRARKYIRSKYENEYREF